MVRTAFRATGEFFVSPCTDGTNDMLKEFRRRGRALTAEYIQKGHVAMGDAFITAFENSSIGSMLRMFTSTILTMKNRVRG